MSGGNGAPAESPAHGSSAATYDTDSAEMERLAQMRDSALKERRARSARVARLERERLDREAQIQEIEAGAEAQRARLAYSVQDAERRAQQAEPYLTDKAEADLSEAKRQLAELEAGLALERGRARREVAAVEARASEEHRRIADLDAERQRLDEQLRQLESDRQAARAIELERQLEELAPLVEAQREAAGITGASDLSQDYAQQAATHQRSWRIWGVALMFSLLLTAVFAIVLSQSAAPDADDTTAQAVATLARDVLLVGLMLYAVRMTSLQFRVHRHMEAVARNKAAALSTFNRIVSVASEKEVRTALATVLAQSVFTADETGFIDAGSDHVTLIERIAGPIADRAARQS